MKEEKARFSVEGDECKIEYEVGDEKKDVEVSSSGNGTVRFAIEQKKEEEDVD